MMNLVNTRIKTSRPRGSRTFYGWLWRLSLSVLFGWLAFVSIVPWAAAQRGYATIGGEYLAVLVAFMLPFCIFRSR